MDRIIFAAATGLVLLCSALFGSAPSALAQSAPAAPDTAKAGTTLWVTTTQRIKSRIYEHTDLGAHPILVIIVHGDSPDEPPSSDLQGYPQHKHRAARSP